MINIKRVSAFMIIVAISVCLLFLFSCDVYALSMDMVLARVNGDTITVRDFSEYISQVHQAILWTKENLNPQGVDLKRELNRLIDRYLMYQEAVRLGLDKEKDYLARVEAQRKQIAINCLRREEVLDKVSVSEEEMWDYYKKRGKRAHIAQIFTKDKEKAKRIIKNLREGASFSEVAKKESEGPYAKKGGDLGYVSSSRMYKELRAVVFSMKEGEYSDIVKTKDGYHIIKLIKKEVPTRAKFEKVKESIKKRLLKKKQRKRSNEFIKQLRGRAKVEINKKLLSQVRTEKFKEQRSEEIIAKVNNVPISLNAFLADFKAALKSEMRKRFFRKVPEAIEKIKNRVLNDLISRVLIEQEAAKRDYYKRKEFKEEMKKWRFYFLVQEFESKIIVPQINVTDADIMAYYEAHKDTFKLPDRVRVRLIKVAKEETAKEILDELKQGANFSLLAREKSLDSSYYKGGDLGFRSELSFPEELRKVIRNLKEGEISDIVHTVEGYNIVKLEERQKTGFRPLSSVKEKVRRLVGRSRFRELLDKYLKQVRAASNIWINEEGFEELRNKYKPRGEKQS